VTEHSERPWGGYTVLAEAADHKVKTIEVHPGQRLSYQRHSRRAEHWFVVRGEGVVTLDGTDIQVARGDTVDVALGAAHRIRNTGAGPLVFWKCSTATTSARTTSSGWKTTTAGSVSRAGSRAS
jgi:mannose-6-phosphate isomerase